MATARETQLISIFDPANFKSTKELAAAEWDKALGNSYVHAHDSTTSSTSAWADVVWTTESVDVLGEFNGTIFTAQRAGIYAVSANVITASYAWGTGPNGDIQMGISKNNASTTGPVFYQSFHIVEAAITTSIALNVSCIMNLAAGDTLRVKYYAARTGGVASALTGGCGFMIARIQ